MADGRKGSGVIHVSSNRVRLCKVGVKFDLILMEKNRVKISRVVLTCEILSLIDPVAFRIHPGSL